MPLASPLPARLASAVPYESPDGRFGAFASGHAVSYSNPAIIAKSIIVYFDVQII
jgi:hypothetical protein